MVNLLDVLPLLQGWSFVRINENISIGANNSKELYETPDVEQGWLLGAVFGADQKDASLQIVYNTAETGQTITFSLKPDDLYSAHRVSPNSVGPYVAVYDDTNNIYEAVFAPAVPFPFDGTLSITAYAGASGADVSADVQLVEITDVGTFMNGLQSVLGVNGIQGYLYSALQQLAQIGNRPIEVKLPAPELPPAPPGKPTNRYTGFWP